MSEKKKVGVLTINDYTNYGNRLQNYALQKTIKSFGFEVKTIVNKTDYIKDENDKFINRIKRIIKMKPKTIWKRFKSKINYLSKIKQIKKAKQIKTNNFKEFTRNYIKETDYSISKKDLIKDIDSKFDFFVTGSDQVWNPTFKHNSYIDFLTFTSKEKRIAFAPSFGISEIPQEFVDDFSKWINGFSNLSVREDAGAKIIKNLTGKDAEVIVDPTMLLSKDEWMDIAKEIPKKPKEKYLLTYILGELSKEKREKIKSIAQNENLKIIDLTNVEHHDVYTSGPSEFLDLISSANIFLTDSFHGTVFSIIFKTPFVIFKRNGESLDMTSRIDTILNKFNLNQRYEMNLNQINKIYDIDFTDTEKILKKEKRKGIEFLKESFSIK